MKTFKEFLVEAKGVEYTVDDIRNDMKLSHQYIKDLKSRNNDPLTQAENHIFHKDIEGLRDHLNNLPSDVKNKVKNHLLYKKSKIYNKIKDI